MCEFCEVIKNGEFAYVELAKPKDNFIIYRAKDNNKYFLSVHNNKNCNSSITIEYCPLCGRFLK